MSKEAEDLYFDGPDSHAARIARQQMRERVGPPSYFAGSTSIPKPLLEWTLSDPIAAALAHKVIKATKGQRWQKFFTSWSFSYPEFAHALEHLGLLIPQVDPTTGRHSYLAAHHFYHWAYLAVDAHKNKDLPCLYRSTLFSSLATLRATPNSAKPAPPSSPPSASP